MRKRWLDLDKRHRRLTIMISLTILLVLTGTVGFMYLEDLSFFDSIWMMVISIMTIGYGDIYPETDNGRIFALLLVPAGAGVVSYGLGTAASYFIEKHLPEKVWEKRMEREINNLKDHIIICGSGRVARQVYKQLKEGEEKIAVLFICNEGDVLNEKTESTALRIIDDPTDKAVLEHAGLSKARALIATLRNDADNVFITLTAKSICPDIEVAARAEKEDSQEILEKAGASYVINPSVLGGRELAMSIVKPSGAEYINDLIRSEKKAFSVGEIEVSASSSFAFKRIEELHLQDEYDILLAAIMRGKELISNPAASEQIMKSDILIVIGKQESIDRFKEKM